MKEFLKWVAYGAVFAVPFVLLWVSGSMFFPYITGKNFAFRILVEIGLAAWILLMLYDKVYRPRLSYIFYAVLGLVGVMFFADLFGEYAHKSFWSNYERMEGWVTLVHFFGYFVLLGSLLNTEKLWSWFLNTALVAGCIMSLYSLGQVVGIFNISQGGDWRVDGFLGNSSYLGVYMLFHIFIAAWLYLRAKSRNLRLFYAVLFLVFGFVLVQTGTRGAVLGLIGGSVLTFSYLALMAPRGAKIKKIALGGLLAVVLIAGGLWAARDMAVVQNSPVLERFADISLSEGNIRFMVWQMAWEGVKERPVLGWGQENFNYVFNKYYDIGLYEAEPWYDRTHNILLDWLIAGGVIGLLAYISILGAALWYAVLLPFWSRFFSDETKDTLFSVPEQALILGLLAAYTFHNLFVFDNLASWIFYAVVLALIHNRVADDWKWLSGKSFDKAVLDKVAAPSVLLVACVVVYVVNVPSILAAQDIIKMYRATTVEGKIEYVDQALGRGGFVYQEIFEHMAQSGLPLLTKGDISEKEKQMYIERFAEVEKEMKQRKPGDARTYVIAGNFYRAVEDLNKAEANYSVAAELSPTKQSIFIDQGLIYLLADQKEQAMEKYRKAYELDKSNVSAQVRLAIAAMYFDEEDLFKDLLPEEELNKKGKLWRELAEDQVAFQLAYQKDNYPLTVFILESRIELNPENQDLRVQLASLYVEMEEYTKARATLNQAVADIPEFKNRGEQLLEALANLEASN